MLLCHQAQDAPLWLWLPLRLGAPILSSGHSQRKEKAAWELEPASGWGHEGILARLTHPLWIPGLPRESGSLGWTSCQVSFVRKDLLSPVGTSGSLGSPYFPVSQGQDPAGATHMQEPAGRRLPGVGDPFWPR